jgi:hypothetical protein
MVQIVAAAIAVLLRIAAWTVQYFQIGSLSIHTKVSRFFYEPMIQFSGILDYRDFFLSDKIALISTLLIVG